MPGGDEIGHDIVARSDARMRRRAPAAQGDWRVRRSPAGFPPPLPDANKIRLVVRKSPCHQAPWLPEYNVRGEKRGGRFEVRVKVSYRAGFGRRGARFGCRGHKLSPR